MNINEEVFEIELEDDDSREQSLLSKNRRDNKRSTLFNPLYATWARVLESHDNGLVDVILQNGMKLSSIGVMSLEWAGANSTRGYGEKDLPPAKSRVLVIFPNGVIEEAFILRSSLSLLGEVGQKHKSILLKSGEARKKIIINEFGWKETYDKDNGKFIIEDTSPGATFKLTVDVSGKSTQLIDHNNNKTTYDTIGIKHEDKNGNKFEMKTGKIVMNDNFEVNQ